MDSSNIFHEAQRLVALPTGDGAGYPEAAGFHSTPERMHKRGWRMEILSWPRARASGRHRYTRFPVPGQAASSYG